MANRRIVPIMYIDDCAECPYAKVLSRNETHRRIACAGLDVIANLKLGNKFPKFCPLERS